MYHWHCIYKINIKLWRISYITYDLYAGFLELKSFFQEKFSSEKRFYFTLLNLILFGYKGYAIYICDTLH
jgi:hypothetical protein